MTLLDFSIAQMFSFTHLDRTILQHKKYYADIDKQIWLIFLDATSFTTVYFTDDKQFHLCAFHRRKNGYLKIV